MNGEQKGFKTPVEEKEERITRALLIAAPAFLMIFSIFLMAVILKNYPLSHKTRIMGTGGFPFILCVLLFCLSAWNLAEVLLKKGQGAFLQSKLDFPGIRRGLLLLLFFLGALLLLDFLGFAGSMALFAFWEMTIFEKPKLPVLRRLLFSILFPLAIQILFAGLYVFLPLPFWWPF